MKHSLREAEKAFQTGEVLKRLSILGDVRCYIGEAPIGMRVFNMLLNRNAEKADVTQHEGRCVKLTMAKIK
jgi:hypothetical protein